MKEHEVKVLKNKAPRKIFVPKRGDIEGEPYVLLQTKYMTHHSERRVAEFN
jgi:hypothetical protein